MRFFRDEAFMEEATARREAERGTFDPSYVVYSVGKLMLLKLRRDCEAAAGDKFSLRAFPRRAAGNGNAAVLAASQADAGRQRDAARIADPVDVERDRRASTPGRCDDLTSENDAALRVSSAMRAVTASRGFRSSPIRSSDMCPVCGGHRAEADLVAGVQFKGTGWYVTDYAPKGSGPGVDSGSTARRRRSGSQARAGRQEGAESDKEADEVRQAMLPSPTALLQSDAIAAKSDKDAARSSSSSPTTRETSPAASQRRDLNRIVVAVLTSVRSLFRHAGQRIRVCGPWLATLLHRRFLHADRPQILAERPREIRTPQREIHHRFQESELVAGVVAHAVDHARIERAACAAVVAARW